MAMNFLSLLRTFKRTDYVHFGGQVSDLIGSRGLALVATSIFIQLEGIYAVGVSPHMFVV